MRSRSRWSTLDGRVVFSPRSQLTFDATRSSFAASDEALTPWYGTAAIGEDIAWCQLPIIRISGIVGVSVAFDFGQIVRSESQPCILGSSQLPKHVFDDLTMLPSRVWHVSGDNPYDMCKIRLAPLRTWYFLRPMRRVSCRIPTYNGRIHTVLFDSPISGHLCK